MYPTPIVFFVVTPCPLREINPPRHVIKTQYKMFKRRTKNMKKTLLILASLIAALALIGCDSTNPNPDEETPSTSTLTGAQVTSRSLAMIAKYGKPSTNMEITIADDTTVSVDVVTNDNGLVAGDVIKSGSKASLSYADGKLTASADINVTLGGTNYSLNGNIIYSIDLAAQSISSVESSTLTITDATGTVLDISNSELISVITPFSDVIKSLISGGSEPGTADFYVPSWVIKDVYTGQGGDGLGSIMKGSTLTISDDSFSIEYLLGTISNTTPGVVVTSCNDDGSKWFLSLDGVTVDDSQVNVDIEISMNGNNINVSVNVGGAMPIDNIIFAPANTEEVTE